MILEKNKVVLKKYIIKHKLSKVCESCSKNTRPMWSVTSTQLNILIPTSIDVCILNGAFFLKLKKVGIIIQVGTKVLTPLRLLHLLFILWR